MNELKEIWKPIKDYEGLYEISNLGNVKSLSKTISLANNGYRKQDTFILKPINAGNGYYRVRLSKEGVFHQCLIHRLVAIHFLPNPNNLPFINHKDEDSSNNRVDNLEWCTPKYNSNYGNRNKKISNALTGKKINITRKSRKFRYIVAVSIIDNSIRNFDSLKEAEQNGFLHSNVSKCCNNSFNKPGNNIYKGYKWYYRENFKP